MIAPSRNATPPRSLAARPLPRVLSIVRCLKNRYTWADMKRLPGTTIPGPVLAARTNNPDLGVSFAGLAGGKAMFLAIDRMPRDRGGSRASRRRWPIVSTGGRDGAEGKGPAFGTVGRRSDGVLAQAEARDALGCAFAGLALEDRRLLLLHYAEGLTFLEISYVLGCSASAVSLRHARILETLRLRLRPEDSQ
jgi:hypothetical protein